MGGGDGWLKTIGDIKISVFINVCAPLKIESCHNANQLRHLWRQAGIILWELFLCRHRCHRRLLEWQLPVFSHHDENFEPMHRKICIWRGFKILTTYDILCYGILSLSEPGPSSVFASIALFFDVLRLLWSPRIVGDMRRGSYIACGTPVIVHR